MGKRNLIGKVGGFVGDFLVGLQAYRDSRYLESIARETLPSEYIKDTIEYSRFGRDAYCITQILTTSLYSLVPLMKLNSPNDIPLGITLGFFGGLSLLKLGVMAAARKTRAVEKQNLLGVFRNSEAISRLTDTIWEQTEIDTEGERWRDGNYPYSHEL